MALRLVPQSQNIAHIAVDILSAISVIKNGISLRVMQGEEFGKIYKLNDIINSIGKRILTIGRNDTDVQNVIPIKGTESSYISRKHCTIEYNPSNDTWTLRDGQWDVSSYTKWKSSMNGTYVGSKEVSTNGTIINIGDIISLGDVKLRVEGY